jgi:cyclase
MPGVFRRDFLSGLLVAATLGVHAAQAAATAPPALTVVRLSARTVRISVAGSNVLATESSDGLVLVDGGLSEHSGSLLAALAREFRSSPIAWLFNTHWHREQTGLNASVGQRRGVVCAHENTRLWLATEYYVDWQDRTYAPLSAVALPNRTFYGTDESLTIGGRSLRYGRLPNAHTDGDVFVHLVDEDILAVGGAVTPDAYPLMDYSTGGWLGGVVDASKALLKLAGSKTRIVAASGPVLSRDALEQQLELATVLRDRVVEQIKLGKSVQDMLDAGITREFDGRYGDPQFFLRSAYRGLWGHIRELGVA